MIPFNSHVKVYLASGVTDMRKSINGLSVLVEEVLHLNPLSSHLFIFCNRGRDKIKILYWSNNGFWLFYRRLERQRFWWPDISENSTLNNEQNSPIEISNRELSWLLEGINLDQVQAHEKVEYSLI